MLIMSTGSKIDIRRCLRSTKCKAGIIYVRWGADANMKVDTEDQKSSSLGCEKRV